MIQRRDFNALAAAALALPVAARAQGAPVEGQQYQKLKTPAPIAAPAGKVEVVEFFWYGCPHCNEFEPMLESWVGKLPADVSFRRVPVAFREEPYAAHQRIYFALEAMGLLPKLHAKVFQAIHGERQKLDKPDAIGDFMAKNGVDKKKFLDVYNSFSMQTKLKQAQALAAAYRIEGVPALGVHGRYLTGATMAGNNAGALRVVEFLVDKTRRGA